MYSRIGISFKGFLIQAYYVVSNQGCCKSLQYKVFDNMLQAMIFLCLEYLTVDR